MEVTLLSDARPRLRRIAIGEFDGVHLGHRQVIAGNDTVLTFEPHPLQVVRPEAAPKLLTSLETKRELIEALGVRELVVIPFDERFAQQSPEEFIEHVLVERLSATHVSVGENFRFGRGAAGGAALLKADARFSTEVTPLVEIDGEIVSSSRIRALVLAGEVERAAGLLGAPYSMRGEVVTGDRRGRALGYPTANLVPDETLVTPGHAVYAAYADGIPAAVNVGVRPTFGTGRAVLVEAYLLDTDADLYGRQLRLDFVARLRGERRFDSVEALVAQMHEDVRRTRELLAA
ncbi:MAG TPA: bifunctional riboflavin kinase/FAD synthetase [Solirubrobacteraceae bacterium]|nr:bifunctional riboflavin kinase/FAD synthetase [Solirubrobacteraceae bacterium]